MTAPADAKSIFADALERPPADRPAFLDAACGDHPTVRAAVARLLAAHDRAGGFLQGDADETATTGLSAGAPAAPGFGPPARPGEVGTLGPYRVLRELGRGGMGAVYAALDTRLDRRLALKVMLPQFAAVPAARERFLREARAAARVKHDHVLTVYEADERDGVAYIATELLEGFPLDEYLKKKGPLSVAQAVRVVAEAAAGLAAAHAHGLVHRDIKPGNLWLEAPRGRVKVLDFGLAKPVDAAAEVTRSGAVVGTPAFMSPEQARGEKVDHRTDLFSLGAVLYRLLTGELPFPGPTTMAVLTALATDEPPPVRGVNPAVPEPLAALVHELLAKRPDARPPSAAEVVRRLWAVPQATRPPAPPAPPASPSQASVPTAVAVDTAVDPFADIDRPDPTAVPAALPAGTTPKRWWPAVAAGFAALLAVAAPGVYIVIRNRDGSETKIEVPDGATVTVKGKDGKTLARVPAEKAPPGAATGDDADRRAAEWALAAGGWVAVRVGGEEREIKAAADLPRDRFTLQDVRLRGCQTVTDAELAVVKDCGALVNVELAGTKVTDAGLAHLKNCTALRRLELLGTTVTDAGLAYLKGHTGLTHLGLVATGVTDAGLAHLKDHTALEHLALGGTKVTDAGLSHLKNCKALFALDLAGTGVTDAGLSALRDFTTLRELHLAGPLVTDAGLTVLKDCRGLTFLGMQDTKTTAGGIADFHAAVPGCVIRHDGGVIEPKR